MSRQGGVESSDFNDGDILAKTTQIPCGAGGAQFKYVLPDGHELKSECVSADNKKRALHAWVDAVKNTAVARARAEREELDAKIRRQRADANRANEAQAAAAMGLIVPEGTTAPSSAASSPVQHVPSATVAASAPASKPSDPLALAKSELVNASLEVQELAPKLAAAQARVKQWQAVLQALQAVELPRESAVIETTPNAQLLRDLLETR